MDSPTRMCPFFKESCKGDDCMLYCASEESMIKKCAFAVMAQQLDIMGKPTAAKGLGLKGS